MPGGVREVIDPVREAAGTQVSGAVQEQAATAVQQIVEAALFHVDVAQAPAEQVGAFTEVVADADRGDLLDQMAVHLVEVHQFGEQPAHGLGPGSVEWSSSWARVLSSTSWATGRRSAW